MLLPDDLIMNKNCSKEMIKIYKSKKSCVIATKRVNPKSVSRWGILSLKNKNKTSFEIEDVIEKPSLKDAPSNYAIIGRYILPKKIMSTLKNQKVGRGGEVHITDAIKNLIYKGEKFYGNIFKGKYLDSGTLEGYIKSNLEISRLK